MVLPCRRCGEIMTLKNNTSFTLPDYVGLFCRRCFLADQILEFYSTAEAFRLIGVPHLATDSSDNYTNHGNAPYTTESSENERTAIAYFPHIQTRRRRRALVRTRWSSALAQAVFIEVNGGYDADDEREYVEGQQTSCVAMDVKCAICYDELQNGSQYFQTFTCRCLFHKNCLQKWASEKNQCPICRVTFL